VRPAPGPPFSKALANEMTPGSLATSVVEPRRRAVILSESFVTDVSFRSYFSCIQLLTGVDLLWWVEDP